MAYEKPVLAAPTARILAKLILNHLKATNIDFMNYDELKIWVSDFYEYSTRYLKKIDPELSTNHGQVMNDIYYKNVFCK